MICSTTDRYMCIYIYTDFHMYVKNSQDLFVVMHAFLFFLYMSKMRHVSCARLGIFFLPLDMRDN